MTKLDATIAAIDDLIKALKSGNLLGLSGASNATKPSTAAKPVEPAAAAQQPAAGKPAAAKPEKAPKAAKPVKSGGGSAPAEGPELFAKAQLVIAKVIDVQIHPTSEKLYITKIDVGNGQERQVVAGLQQYIPVDQLQGSLVVVILNLKPAKLGGELSEAMILAASFVQEDGGKETVKTLTAPEGSEPGDVVYLEGETAPDAYPKTMKGEHWRKVVSGLKVENGSYFEKKKMMTAKGEITAPGMDGAEIH